MSDGAERPTKWVVHRQLVEPRGSEMEPQVFWWDSQAAWRAFLIATSIYYCALPAVNGFKSGRTRIYLEGIT